METMRLTVPCVGDEEIQAVADVIKSGWLSQGKKVEAFEDAVAEYLNVKYAVAVNSCTSSMHLALRAIGVSPGDSVIASDFTYPATGSVVDHCGANPVLADIDLETFALNPAKLEELIGPLTKAILLVHPFGLAADLDPIMEIADRRGIPVINDAACALGTTYKGKHISNFGAATCFSFHPRKVITTGEGGMVVTNDELIASRVRELRNHGISGGLFVRHGFNYWMSDVNAAIGLVQMEKLDWIINERRKLAAQLSECLQALPLRLPSGEGHIFQSYVVMLPEGMDRNRLIAELRKRGIETTIGTYALHLQPAFESSAPCPRSAEAYRRTMTLPLYPGMDIRRLCEVLNAYSW